MRIFEFCFLKRDCCLDVWLWFLGLMIGCKGIFYLPFSIWFASFWSARAGYCSVNSFSKFFSEWTICWFLVNFNMQNLWTGKKFYFYACKIYTLAPLLELETSIVQRVFLKCSQKLCSSHLSSYNIESFKLVSTLLRSFYAASITTWYLGLNYSPLRQRRNAKNGWLWRHY